MLLKTIIFSFLFTALCFEATAQTRGIWISSSEIASLESTGPAWNALLLAANSPCGIPDLADQDSLANVCVLAHALVFAKTGTATYRTSVVSALQTIINTPYSGRALALGRELGAYVVAADLIDLATYNPSLNTQFRSTLRTLLTTPTIDGPTSLIDCHEARPNNWGSHCGASRAAVALYLNDQAELTRVAQVFRGWLGDRTSYAGFEFGELDWQCNPLTPVAINPMGCTKNGHNIDGVIPDDQRRSGIFIWPPPKENYVWESLQGALMQAELLFRAGYPVYQWENSALLRAYQWLHDQADYPAEGDDTWQPHLINYRYHSNFPSPPARSGKNMGFTDWTHPQGAPDSLTPSPPQNLRVTVP